jgi:NAD-dependent dihydropyrimidine dehydrogenase PreA subunit
MAVILPAIDEAACQGCGDCIPACPGSALAMASSKAHLAHPEDCTYCGDCELICPHGAIQLPLQIVLRSPDVTVDN